jgi:hypothetical protein
MLFWFKHNHQTYVSKHEKLNPGINKASLRVSGNIRWCNCARQRYTLSSVFGKTQFYDPCSCISWSIRTSFSRRTCVPRRKSIEKHITIINTPLNIKALCMLSGGDAVRGARSAPSTKTNMIPNKLPLECGIISCEKHGRSFERIWTHKNQSNAELPLEFLVSSHPSSSPIGNIVIEPAPMIATTANNPPVLPGLTAHIKLNQPPAITGTRTFEVTARWCVNTRSKSGAVIIATTSPERRRAAPNRPEVISE